jgi:hypothetical protein
MNEYLNEERITNKVLNMKIKGKCPRGRQKAGQKQQVRKSVIDGRLGINFPLGMCKLPPGVWEISFSYLWHIK